MALFDFLKKKELSEIDRLSIEVERLKEECSQLSAYRGIIDIDKEIAKKKKECIDEIASVENKKSRLESDIEGLKRKYNEAYAVYQKLKREIDLYSESLDIAEYGIYQPHFDFDTSEKFKSEIISVREMQKETIKAGFAVIGGESISWNGSLVQGQAMVKREKKLMLRAFNGECDSFIAAVDWNNVAKMKERIEKSFESINAIYKTQGLEITSQYADYKTKELILTYEHKRKKKEEKEEQRAARELIREEEKSAREFEAARIKAEKEAEACQKAINKAKQEADKTGGVANDELLSKIKELEERLKEAEQNKERAISMAQQTRRGHVYIISNIGSFGENVYKIGMTRRLEPIDRVKELGDASVPFRFDVHAMIFSEDAPKLEQDLHQQFENKRLNAINNRKEFFSVSIDEIEQFISANYKDIEFIKTPEAEEYRETIAIKKRVENIIEKQQSEFPEELFK